MNEHDHLCPWHEWDSPRTENRCYCSLIAKARAEEKDRVAAVCKMLLDSGDITPMGVRLLTKSADD